MAAPPPPGGRVLGGLTGDIAVAIRAASPGAGALRRGAPAAGVLHL